MEYRPLGRTGVQVSKLCLGTMMFGAWGNADHDDSVRIIHRALDAGVNFVDTRRRLLRRRVGGDRRQGAQGPPRRRRAGDEVLGADGRGPEPRRRLAALDHRARSRTRCGGSAPTGSTSTRCTAPTRHGHRRDARRAHRPRPAGQGPLHRLVVVLRGRDRRGAVGRARAEPPALPHRAAAVLAARARHRARRPADRPAPRHGHPHLQPAGRRLAVGPLDRGQLADVAGPAAAGRAVRHVAAREPAQARSGRGSSARSPTTPGSR